MEHIAAFLLIIGCSEDLTQCRELPAPAAIFETIEDCDAELPYAFRDFVGAHPQLFAQCFEVDPLLTEADAEIVWEITEDGHLSASVEPIDDSEVVVASNLERDETEAAEER